MTIQKSNECYIAECDSCDDVIILKLSTPCQVRNRLLKLGWRRFDFVGNIRYPAFLWSCLKCKDKKDDD